ncbi:MAG: hypothetical protein AB1489_02275 [Acidobacteriota bacterium]
MGEQLQRLTQKAMAAELAMLWATSQFFTTLQNIMIEQELTPDINLAELHSKMATLSEANVSEVNSLLAEIQRALQQARVSIALIDSRISVSVIRRFFERVGEFDSNALTHIVRYYLSKPAKDGSDRDKIDLLVTRLCSYTTSTANNLKLRQAIENLEDFLEDLCHSKRTVELESIQTASIAKLRMLSRMILEVRSFNALIEGKLLSQLREYKISLEDAFYTPMVLAEMVKVNVAVHNKFQELYYSEQARLRMETARLLRNIHITGEQETLKKSEHPAITQLSNLTIQMQQYLQELKRTLTDQILQNRATRASIEAEGNSLTLLIGSLEESLKRSRELLKKLQDMYARVEDKEEVH